MAVHTRLPACGNIIGERIGGDGENGDGPGICAVERADGVGGVKPVKHGHHDVHEDDIEAARSGSGKAIYRLLPVFGGGDKRAALFEHIGRDLAVERVVLGHEDADAVEPRARLRLGGGHMVRCVDRQRQRNGEGRSLSFAADEGNFAAEQLDGLLYDSEAEAAAGIGRARGLMLLREGIERAGLKFRAHADAGIGTGEDEGRRIVFAGGLAAGNVHRAAGTVVFDGVAHDILQHALNVQRAAEQVPVLACGRIGGEDDAAVRRLRRNDRLRALQHVAQVKGLVLGLDLAGFELAHVEHIVDELEQEIRGRKDFGEAVLHPRGIGDILFGNLRHAADAVERRADIVTHTAQKIGLCGVGHRGLLGGLAQALLVVDLLLLLRGDVARKQHDGRDLTGLTAALRDEQYLKPLAVHRLEGIAEKALVAQTLRRGRGAAEITEGVALPGDDDVGRDGLEHLVRFFDAVRHGMGVSGLRDGLVGVGLRIDDEIGRVNICDGGGEVIFLLELGDPLTAAALPKDRDGHAEDEIQPRGDGEPMHDSRNHRARGVEDVEIIVAVDVVYAVPDRAIELERKQRPIIGQAVACDGVFADGVSTGAGFLAKVFIIEPGQPWKTGLPRRFLFSSTAFSS